METVNDIIVDMRQRASVACGQDDAAMVHHNAIGDMLVDIAGRIEAAWKREREEMMDKHLELEKEFTVEAIVKLFRAVEEAEGFVKCVGSIWLNNAARFAESGKRSVLCRDGAEHLMQKYHDAQKCIELMSEARSGYAITLRMQSKEEIDAEYEKQRKEYHKKERENHD